MKNTEYITVYIKYKDSDGYSQETITSAEKRGKKIIVDEEYTKFDKNPTIIEEKNIVDPKWLIVFCDSEFEAANLHHLSMEGIWDSISHNILSGKECEVIRGIFNAIINGY